MVGTYQINLTIKKENKMKKLFVVFVMLITFGITGCASFNVNNTITNGAIAGIGLILANNPTYKADVCKNLIALQNALNADCCWNDYLITINNTFKYNDKYKVMTNYIITMLQSDKPILGMINMSDGDKTNIKADLEAIIIGIGCNK
jgi:hypothetical protein